MSTADDVALFECWAPPGGRWSPWAKPVLFAHRKAAIFDQTPAPQPIVEGIPAPTAPARVDWSQTPPANGTIALILDLPGVEAVHAAVALADRGYQPVPLFNTTPGKAAAVDAVGIIRALIAGGVGLAPLPSDAPPAFLLDSNRYTKHQPKPGQYDNRWVVYPQDFPSAEFLGGAGVREVVVVQRGTQAPPDDLRDVLVRYRRGGLEILRVNLDRPEQPEPLDLPRYRPWRWIRALALLTLGLRPNAAGGFGSIVPHPSSG